ncbi:MAG: methylated-DNA--[protein]-cysteine S-methyltransferase [Clostridia bacterium]|nr:MAG: methylated-DNA--[protein]-cysteine S-methyltransferase [Clostridia bacterium]
MYYGLWPTAWGWVAAAASGEGLICLILPQETREQAAELAKTRGYGGLEENAAYFTSLFVQVEAYFAGTARAVEFPLDLSALTTFQREVLAAVRAIPYGEVRSYKWVAECIRRPRACRAVGQALRNNPVPVVVPCHRVVGEGGELGGFAWGEGYKRRLLALEGYGPAFTAVP